MNKVLVYCHHYWEFHWLYKLIIQADLEVCTDNSETQSIIDKYQCKTVNAENITNPFYQVLVVSIMHFGEHQKAIKQFIDTGRKVVVVQHAWDSALNLYNEFWNMDMHKFTLYCVGGQQDYQFLSGKHGESKIKQTGMPRFDMLMRVKEMDLTDIHEKVGKKEFLLATCPVSSIHDDRMVEEFYTKMPEESPLPIVYKIHPGGTIGQFNMTFPHLQFIDDNKEDIYETYKLIQASSGVISPASFLSIEATMLGKPVILYGDINVQTKAAQQHERQEERLPRDMSSTFQKLEFTKTQQDMLQWYDHDGKCTERVINEINQIL